MFGTIIHSIAEAQFEGQDWEEVLNTIELDNRKLFKREIEMYGNIIEDIRYIMKDYFAYWANHPTDNVKPIEHDGRKSEHEFRIELAPGIWFTGKIDALVKARKLKWLMEHKSFSRMPSEDDRWKSIQTAVYFRALEMMGFDAIDGVLWDYVSSKPLNVPGELTPTGKVSQRAIDSVPSRVKAWIKEEGHNKKDYAKLITDAEANRRNRYIRLFSPVKRSVVKTLWSDFIDTAKEIQDFHGRKKDQNIGRHCNWCDYNELCKAELTGSDIDWIIDRNYTTESTNKALINGDDRSED
jgi:hypothetical protein